MVQGRTEDSPEKDCLFLTQEVQQNIGMSGRLLPNTDSAVGRTPGDFPRKPTRSVGRTPGVDASATSGPRQGHPEKLDTVQVKACRRQLIRYGFFIFFLTG